MAIITPTRQQERREASTRALLDAAGELVLEGGFSAMTFAAIGERAGYSRTMVTARFGSKQGLVEAMLERLVGTWRDRTLVPDPERPGLETILAFVDAVEAQAAHDATGMRVLYALMFEAVSGDELLHAHFREFHRDMRSDIARILRNGRADGSVRRELDPDAEAAFVVTALRGIAFQWMLDAEQFDGPTALGHLRGVLSERFAN